MNPALMTKDEAKKIACKSYELAFKNLRYDKSLEILEDFFMESDRLWMFFLNKNAQPENVGFAWTDSISIGKNGEILHTFDFRPDMQKQQEYFDMLSTNPRSPFVKPAPAIIDAQS